MTAGYDDAMARHIPRSELLLAALLLACVELRPPSSAGDLAASTIDPATTGESKPAKVDADRFGVGWLERDGVFESYNERVRFRRPPGWELLVDDVVVLGQPGAGSGLYDPEADIAIYFILERHVELPHDSYRALRRETALARSGASSPEPPMTATFANTQLVFDAVSGGTNDEEYLYAVHFVEGDALQIVVSYPRAGDREQLRERIRSALAQVEWMTRSEVEAIRAELARGPDTQNYIGPTWSLRRGVYRDFARDIQWTSPSRDWVIFAGRLAEGFGANTTLIVQNRMARLVGRLSLYDDPRIAESDGAAWHEASVATFVDQGVELVGERRRLMIGGAEALVQTLAIEVSGERAWHVLATTKHGSVGLAWLISGPVPQVEANLALIEAVLLETHVSAGLVETGMDGSRWVDLRLGYSVEVPPDYQLGQSIDVDKGSEVTQWGTADGSAAFGVQTQAWASTGWTNAELVAENEAFFIDLWGASSDARAGSLDGEDGRHLRWDGSRTKNLLIVNRDHTVYMLIVEGDDPELFERVRESFAFVD